MSIDLGLSRVTRLLGYLGNPHHHLKVLHVAGTNGKGSVCSYLSSVLQRTQGRIGKFTSPHLCHVRDSITVNHRPITMSDYTNIRNRLKALDREHGLECTEFELLTVTALSYFYQIKCSWCVVEVGLGGRLDATNVIAGEKKICGITKIGLDHESFLGNNLRSIAKEKAGIIVDGSKFVALDGSNEPEVIEVVRDQANAIGCRIKVTETPCSDHIVDTESWGSLKVDKLPLKGAYQIFNVQVALYMLDYLQLTGSVELNKEDILKGIESTEWPGRLQFLNYHFAPRKSLPVLFDGAHNGSAAIELGKYLDGEFRFKDDEPLTFVLAVTQGKNLEQLLSPIIRPHDHVICTEFGSVEGMPWIKAMDVSSLANEVRRYTKNVSVDCNMTQILPQLQQQGLERKVVVCGSLYLCGQLLSVHYDNMPETT